VTRRTEKDKPIKTHFGIKCEALVLILPPNEYKRRTSDDDTFGLKSDYTKFRRHIKEATRLARKNVNLSDFDK
jgi:hypothetical protein